MNMKVIKDKKTSNICLREGQKGLMQTDKTKINLWLDPEPYKRLKFLALKNDVTITSIINELIISYVEANE